MKKVVLPLVMMLLVTGGIMMGCSDMKAAGRDIGHATRDVTRTIGHTTRDVTKEIGHKSRDAAKAIGNGTRDAVQSVGEGWE